MKILVLQLTRPGDIFCTVPALSALRRAHPQAEVHYLVRKRFSQAALVAKLYDHLWQMDAQKLLGDFIVGDKSITKGITRLSEFIHDLRSEKFDFIINLSFTPSSSFISHLVSEGGKVPVIGYTRTSDHYLFIPDLASRYFKSQGGLDKSNRVHIVDLLGEIAGVTIKESDVHFLSPKGDHARSGVICHLAASQNQKTWPVTSWVAFLNRILGWYTGEITLVGGKEDAERATEVLQQLKSNKITNKVGDTDWASLSDLLKSAELFVGADSGPLHMANLCRCPILNLSVGDVRFWETGPTVTGSRVLRARDPSHLMSDSVFFHFQQLLLKGTIYEGAAVCTNENSVRYTPFNNSNVEPDAWAMVNWMYFQGPIPHMNGDLPEALKQIAEIVDISISQIEALEKNSERSEIIGVLDRLDEVLEVLRKNIPPLAPLIDEFQTNKENIPPVSRKEIFYQTKKCYLSLGERVKTLLPKEVKKGTQYESTNDRVKLDII